ncbi:hypothetical protein HDV00_004088 [Rhizophlyctis rosea]|nr:hypothetical protein HDV00_004088 [Rhizophlyctis rosea]
MGPTPQKTSAQSVQLQRSPDAPEEFQTTVNLDRTKRHEFKYIVDESDGHGNVNNVLHALPPLPGQQAHQQQPAAAPNSTIIQGRRNSRAPPPSLLTTNFSRWQRTFEPGQFVTSHVIQQELSEVYGTSIGITVPIHDEQLPGTDITTPKPATGITLTARRPSKSAIWATDHSQDKELVLPPFGFGYGVEFEFEDPPMVEADVILDGWSTPSPRMGTPELEDGSEGGSENEGAAGLTPITPRTPEAVLGW